MKRSSERRTHLTATEAAQQLGITESTLYAYVSRGLIRSEDCDGSKRTRKYSAEDVYRLNERKELRKNPDKAAENALSWGAPILDSAITLISEGRLYYRGYDAIELAKSKTFEEVTSLLWTGYFPDRGASLLGEAPNVGGVGDLGDFFKHCHSLSHELDVFERAQLVMPFLAAGEITMHDLRPAAVAVSARKILLMIVHLVVGESEPGRISDLLQKFWAPGDAAAKRLFDAALVLSADHELDPSTFTARCVASTRAHPCAVVSACLSALQGKMYREKYFQIENFFQDVRKKGDAKKAVACWLKEGMSIPGFTHPLYPLGDPRAKFILELLADGQENSAELSLIFDVVREMENVLDERPNLELGLFALSTKLRLDVQVARTVFMIGRSAGWMAHAIEQYQVREFFRPRARYVGEPPKSL